MVASFDVLLHNILQIFHRRSISLFVSISSLDLRPQGRNLHNKDEPSLKEAHERTYQCVPLTVCSSLMYLYVALRSLHDTAAQSHCVRLGDWHLLSAAIVDSVSSLSPALYRQWVSLSLTGSPLFLSDTHTLSLALALSSHWHSLALALSHTGSLDFTGSLSLALSFTGSMCAV